MALSAISCSIDTFSGSQTVPTGKPEVYDRTLANEKDFCTLRASKTCVTGTRILSGKRGRGGGGGGGVKPTSLERTGRSLSKHLNMSKLSECG